MASVCSLWLRWGTVCSLLMFLFAEDGLWDCGERDDLLKDAEENVDVPSECTLSCTAITYQSVLQSQQKTTVRFRDSYRGEAEEHCWSTQIKCSSGQQLQEAFILLPVDLSIISGETVRLQMSSEMLQQDTRHSLLSPDCGLRFDITQLLPATRRQKELCVKVLKETHTALDKALRCPPFMVTVWKHGSQGEG